MPADDLPDNDDANAPDTTSGHQCIDGLYPGYDNHLF